MLLSGRDTNETLDLMLLSLKILEKMYAMCYSLLIFKVNTYKTICAPMFFSLIGYMDLRGFLITNIYIVLKIIYKIQFHHFKLLILFCKKH